MNGARVFLLILGAAIIVYGFITPRFYPTAFGVGDRTRTIPKWVGRTWFALIGLWFIYIGLVGRTPAMVQRIIAVAIGLVMILSGLAARRKSESAAPEAPLGISPRAEPLGGLLFVVVGIFFILGGLLLTR